MHHTVVHTYIMISLWQPTHDSCMSLVLLWTYRYIVCAPPALGYVFVKTHTHIYICWLRPQVIMRVCCACDAGDGPIPVFKVAVRRPAAGSNSWTRQTHECGQQGRRQGRPRGGQSIKGKAENNPSGWTLRSLYALLALCGPWGCSLSPTPGDESKALTEG